LYQTRLRWLLKAAGLPFQPEGKIPTGRHEADEK
jgi:hypothetical protein